MESACILVVEDEIEIQQLIRFSLEREQFEVLLAETAEQALQCLADNRVDLALVDWMLPGGSGIELCQRLRDDHYSDAMPIIMLTARSEEEDKLQGFAAGVDDYLTKPFSPKELIARIKALLRRVGKDESGLLEHKGIKLDQNKLSLSAEAVEIKLGPTEFRLFHFLLSQPERTFSREQLLNHVWGRSVYLEERTVDVHVLRLRKLLQKAGIEKCLVTVRGLGYRFSAAE